MVKGQSEVCRAVAERRQPTSGSVIGVGRKEEPGRTGRISQWGFEHPQDDLAKKKTVTHLEVLFQQGGGSSCLQTLNKATYLPHPAGNPGRANLISMYKHE